MRSEYPLTFERSRPGRRGYRLPTTEIPQRNEDELLPQELLRIEKADLPELSEVDVVRHYTGLSRRNFGVDLGFYPLGSCTMKYNPKINEDIAALDGFARLHPLVPQSAAQGTLKLMYSLIVDLAEITGMSWGTLQPFAGAQGEYTGMKLFKAYFKDRGESQRTKVLVPDSSHGTNPASAHIAGFEVVEVPSDERGLVTVEALEEHLDETLAGIMLTNPNTLGLFEAEILAIAARVHEAGGLLYYDGANLNAVMGKCRPGDMGFDVVHLNLHKTFSTPHGGGGPGAGPVLVNERLRPYLPSPDVIEENGEFRLVRAGEKSIGRVAGFYGNVGVMVRAAAYIRSMGCDGLVRASELAVLNANYLRVALRRLLEIPYGGLCKHEFVLSARRLKEQYGISATDIAKGLIDRGIHPPTVYFPLIVPEALMVEPTETESRETLDTFIEVLKELVAQAAEDPDALRNAPLSTPVGRLNEVLAARKPIVAWREESSGA